VAATLRVVPYTMQAAPFTAVPVHTDARAAENWDGAHEPVRRRFMKAAFDWLRDNAAVVSAITALVAVTVGPSISYLIAKKQIIGNVIASNRIKWIENLREDIAEFVALFSEHIYEIGNYHLLKDNDLQKSKLESLAEIVRGVSTKRFLIRIKLNPDEQDHGELLSILDETTQTSFAFLSDATKSVDVAELSSRIAKVARRITKAEWERAKNIG
jgi:hypothetical protein